MLDETSFDWRLKSITLIYMHNQRFCSTNEPM